MRVFLLPALALATAALAAGALAGESWEPGGGIADATPLEARGRDVFRAEACWTCHGPKARPHVLVLERPGPLRPTDWLTAHLFAPRLVSSGSPMPGSPHLYTQAGSPQVGEVGQLIKQFDATGDGRVSFADDAGPTWQEQAMRVGRMSELDTAGLRVPRRSALQTRTGEELWLRADGTRAYLDRWRPGEEQGDALLSLRDARPRLGDEGHALLAYVRAVQRPTPLPLGDALGKDGLTTLLAMGGRLVPRRSAGGVMRARVAAPRTRSSHVAREGAALYRRHCLACHGPKGRGDGIAARFLDTPPTDFVKGRFKYRSTRVGQRPLLTDLYRTVRHGLPGSGMAGMRSATPNQVWAVVLHMLALAGTPRDSAAPLIVPPVPVLRLRAAAATDVTYRTQVDRGKALFVAFECSRCHGTEGRGDGPDAISEWSDGRLIRARDFKPRDERDPPRHRLRGGARPEDLWRTIMTGLDKEGMPGVHTEFAAARAAGKPFPVQKRLVQPLKDPRLFAVGVVASDDGPYEERIDRLFVGLADGQGWQSFGDDWSLVLYVLHLTRTNEDVVRGTIAWPNIEVGQK